METRFDHIDINNEKIHRIINAAFEVFSKNEPEKASTNSIVKLAGISRGLLYHYFKDKRELFDFLVFFSIKILFKEMDAHLNWEETDFLKRIRQAMVIQSEIYHHYSYMMDFFVKCSRKFNQTEIRRQSDKMAPGWREKFYHYNLDFSQVKEGIGIKKMIKIVRWTITGIYEEFREKSQADNTLFDSVEFIAKIDEYSIMLRKLFYK